ncbi:hypothetical protein CLV30_114101 [Haloactinopolyspora alba]|uniref:Uncharacterized protein n=1 Tax=Haloactinopolyspora alba TaxID=648780 RepID=A0A2P8DVZ5_9ACTN|nr:hypothetical protein [Haloactinopolyspora alba]PSL01371.1 hypothetical protein CLV30_114101 [Haloactinopolyspora alba]
MTDDQEHVETVKYYTRARKFPQLLGRMPDGTKIPGGPYTVQQLIVAIAIIVVGGMTISTWGVFGFFGNIAVLFGSAFGAVFVVGRVPMNGRNPFFAVVGLFRAVGAPRTGRYRGRPIRIRRPRRLTHRTNVYLEPLPGTERTGDAVPAETADVLPGRLRRRARVVSAADAAGIGSGGVDVGGVYAGGVDAGGARRSDGPGDMRPSPARTPATASSGPLTGVQALLALADDDAAGDDRTKDEAELMADDTADEPGKVVR